MKVEASENSGESETPTSWDFTISGGFEGTIQNTSATILGLEIDATASGAKFYGRDAESQVNAGTIIKVPVSGNSTITVVAYDNTGAKSLTFNGEAGTVNDKTATYEYTGEAGKVTVAVTANIYLVSMKVEASTVSDGNTPIEKNYLTLDGDEVSYDFRVSTFAGLGKDASTTYSHSDGILSIDGSFSYKDSQHGATVGDGTILHINAPAGRTIITLGPCQWGSASVALYLGEDELSELVAIGGLSTDSETVTLEYTSEEAVTLSVVVSGGGWLHYLKAKSVTPPNSYVLSGSLTGLTDAELASLSALNFAPTTTSEYVVPEATIDASAGTYSIELEQGTAYTVTALGVGNKVVKTTVPAYTTDTALDLVFEEAPTYKVTINKTTQPDLSSKSCQYVYTHEDGNVYSFSDMSAISLRDGSYTFEITGELEQIPYKISAGTTLEVAGVAVSHLVKFEEVTSWTFGSKGYTKDINGGTGYYQGLYVDATTGKLTGRTSDAQFNTGAIINVPVNGDCSISVTASSNAIYALYKINGVQASTTEMTTVVDYTGEAGYVQIISTGTAYITGIKVTYPATEVEFVEQDVMPFVPADDTDANTAHDTDDIPRASKKDTLVVQPTGQKLTLNQSGGSASGAYDKIQNLGYYIFPMTEDDNKLEFDLRFISCGSNNEDGVFIGLFNNSYMYSLGIRQGTNTRAIYSKATEGNGDFAGAGGIDYRIELGEPLHIVVEKDGGEPVVTYTRVNTGEQASVAPSVLECEEAGYYYGLIVSDAKVEISNMVYTAADGTVLYNQNSCYYPLGTAPVATSVSAVAADTREYIDITWDGTVPEYDGTYVVEMQRDGGEWTTLATDVTDFSYRYILPEGEGGNYLFRVCGQLGNKDLGGSRSSYVTMTDSIYVLAALAKPVVTITGNAESISLSWNAVEGASSYEIYRYSYDETAEGKQLLTTITTTSYADSAVELEVPYYYEVKAVSASNYSPLSATVWAVPSAGHTGDYVYEDEATEIFITKKSYDTVFNGSVVLEGNVYGDGTLKAVVNGTTAESEELSAGDAFSFTLSVEEGRNDVNLLFTDADGGVTRKTFNFVYLTNYDMVVDSAYTGTDGAANENGIPTYKTVQAAVDAVSASNNDSKVILVMAGDYEERLEVSSPYITLVGEDRENTLIHCYPADILNDTDAEAGGDMSKRCATIIYNTATGFSAENISFANDYVYSTPDNKSNKSADAIRVEADQASFVNVKFTGVQDTLYMHSGKQYYYKCIIEGLIDFIYSGDDARAYFNDCDIVFLFESTKKGGYVCAPKTAEDAEYGLTFNNCRIIGEEGCSGTGYLLARPWGPNAYITWINCYMGESVNELAPYSDMSGNPYTEARFFEFGSYGPGYAINADRRQISPNKAAEMISASFLGWNPASVVAAISADHYVGSLVTDRDDQYAEDEKVDDTYLWTDGDDTGLKMYDMEGYADAYEVTGGGLLKESSENYYKVATAKEFLDALVASKNSGKDSVIELTADINLGCNEVENFSSYSSVIKAYGAQPLTHPTLIESGVSQLTLDGVYNLTIFSSNASSIKHANITMKNSENIIIRNIKFDELWEWDEATGGNYDRNDWDYMTVDSNCNGIWIDHCTFYKAYDGIIDVKNPSPIVNVTVSWCEFLPGSENNTFFDVMMDEVYANPSTYATYQHMLDEGMTDEQVYMYAYGQKKTHLLGQSDEATNAAGIRVTLANNYYKNSMDRMPRLRYGNSHVYNCIMDAQDLLDVRLSIANEEIAMKIVSNGAASTCGAQVLLENCYISGIQNALNSGNGSSTAGYINAINSLYFMDGVETLLEPKNNGTADDIVLVTDAESFISGLPYADYVLYDAEDLNGIVKYYAGAGKLNLTNLQWEKTSYNAEWKDPVIVEEEDPAPTNAPEETGTPAPTTEPETTATPAPGAGGQESTPAPTTEPEATPAPTQAPSSGNSNGNNNNDNRIVIDANMDWREVDAIISSLAEGEDAVIEIVLGQHHNLPSSLVLAIQGRNITLSLVQDNGVIWEINGLDVERAIDLSLRVVLDSGVFAEDRLSAFDGYRLRQITLMHNGDFGFKAKLKFPAESSDNGKYANLFYYNANKNRFEYQGSCKIANGYSEFTFTHASDYVLVISENPLSVKSPTTGDELIIVEKTNQFPMFFGILALAAVAVLGTGMLVIRRKEEE